MEKVKIDCWDKISIGLYEKVYRELQGIEDPIDMDITLIAGIMGVDADEIFAMNVEDVFALRKTFMWLHDFKYDEKWDEKKVEIGGRKYDVYTDMNKFTYAQFLDYQQTSKAKDDRASILATILVPEGYKYNEGYDLADEMEHLRTHCPITLFYSIQFFFLKTLMISYQRIATYLEKEQKRMEKKEKSLQKRAKAKMVLRHKIKALMG